MKKILTLLALFTCLISSAQVYQPYSQYGNEFNRTVSKLLAGIPRDTVAPITTWQTYPHIAAKGTNLFLWDTATRKWNLYSPGGTSWLLTGNAGTTAGTNFIGTTDAVGLVWKTNGQTRLQLPATELQPGSGSDSVLVKDGSGFIKTRAQSAIVGVTPTWQQILNATGGSVLDAQSNSITGSEPLSFSITASGVTGQATVDAGNTTITGDRTGATSSFQIKTDTIWSRPHKGLYYIDTLTNVPGTKSLRYNPSTGLVSYADTTAATTSLPISSLTAATGTNSINNGASQQAWAWNTLAGGAGLYLSTSTTAASGSSSRLVELNLSGANASSGQTTTGLLISNDHSGTTSSNIGASISATNGTNNYAIIVPPSSGLVGIGTSTPTALLEIGAGSTSAGGSPLKFNSASPTTVGVAGQLMFKDGMLILDSTSSHRDTLATRNWVRNNATGGGGGGSTSPGGSDTYVQFNDAGSFGGHSGMVYDKTNSSFTTGRVITDTITGVGGNLRLLAGSSSGEIFINDGFGGAGLGYGAGGISGIYSRGSFLQFVQGYGERMRILAEGVVIHNTTLNASAALQVDATTRGFLPPRMTTTEKNAISSPAEGLVVYDLTLHKLCVYTGSAWETITSL